MAVNKVGDVLITKDNAYDFVLKDEKGEIDLTVGQRHYAEGLLTDEQRDEIQYELTKDKDYNKKKGAGGIDTEGADNSNNKDSGLGFSGNAAVGGAVVGSVAAAAAMVYGQIPAQQTMSKTNGWIALIGAGMATALSLVAMLVSGRNTFDPGSDVREQLKNQADENNAITDEKKNILEDSMDMMNEDVENYEKGNEELSNLMNSQAADGADLEQQIADAEGAGDIKKAAQVRKQLQELKSNNFEDKKVELEETREGLGDYQAHNDEAVGLVESGDQVAKFLQFGNKLSDSADKAKTAFRWGAALLLYCVVQAAIPKVWALAVPLDGAQALIASILFAAGATTMGLSANKMGNNENFEAECGQKGDEMLTHVQSLSEMVPEQQNYIVTATTSYDNSDEKQEKIREKGQKAAEKLKPDKKGPVVVNNKDDEEKKKEGDKAGTNA